jgi:hypothetical protein
MVWLFAPCGDNAASFLDVRFLLFVRLLCHFLWRLVQSRRRDVVNVLPRQLPERDHVRAVRCEHVLCGRLGDLMHGVPERPDGARGLYYLRRVRHCGLLGHGLRLLRLQHWRHRLLPVLGF